MEPKFISNLKFNSNFVKISYYDNIDYCNKIIFKFNCYYYIIFVI